MEQNIHAYKTCDSCLFETHACINCRNYCSCGRFYKDRKSFKKHVQKYKKQKIQYVETSEEEKIKIKIKMFI